MHGKAAVLLALPLVWSSAWEGSVRAEVGLPAVIGDRMVLQRGRPIPIWGRADPGEKVAVELGGRRAAAEADAKGDWRVDLEPLEAGGPHVLTVKGTNTIRLEDVLVGEVWICSGQSNMQFAVRGARNAQEEIAKADYPRIRLFTVKRRVAHEPQRDTEGAWSVCSPKTVPGFSAVGFFFGRAIHEALDVPVGLIHTSWGGTPAEAWTSRETLEAFPAFEPILERWAEIERNHPKAMEEYGRRLEAWKQAAAKAKAQGKRPPRRPRPPAGPDHPHGPSGLFNGMIAPLIPYAIQGAIWYQGESNAGRAYQYRTLFPAMIEDWRMAWGQGDFPFLFVQLANFMAVKPEPSDSAWAELREAQTMALSLPRTGMAVAIDIGEARDIHPKNKQDVGRRLALAAEAIAYGRDLVYSGPLYESMTIEGGRARVRFRHAGEGLVARGGGPLEGFAIAGRDRRFVRAEARIEGDAVLVWSDRVPRPVAVRYAWADNPVCNLANRAGLPASPFRTDAWPGVTVGSR